MSGQAWTFLGIIVTTLAGIVTAYWQWYLPLKRTADEQADAAASSPPSSAVGHTAEYIASLQSQVRYLSGRRDALVAERDQLRGEHADLRVDLAKLTARAEVTDGRISRLEGEVTRLESEVARLESEVARLEAENARLRGRR